MTRLTAHERATAAAIRARHVEAHDFAATLCGTCTPLEARMDLAKLAAIASARHVENRAAYWRAYDLELRRLQSLHTAACERFVPIAVISGPETGGTSPEVQCPKCGRSAVRPDFATCDDCAPDGVEASLHTFAAARDLVLEAVGGGILDGEALDNLGADPRLEEDLRALSAGSFAGIIDREKSRARLAERARLGRVLGEWISNGTVRLSAADASALRSLLATDY